MPAWMSAPEGIEKPKAFIAEQDKDGDGKVSEDETMAQIFTARDINKDGFVTLDEAPGGIPKPKTPETGVDDVRKRGPHVEGGASGIEFMNQFDLNKDGKISHGEWETVKPTTPYREKHWPEYDINWDWCLSLDEAPLKEGESEAAPE